MPQIHDVDPARARRNEFGQPIGDPVADAGALPARPVVLTGRTCTLEPLAVGHAAELLAALQAGADDAQWTYLPYGPCHGVDEMATVLGSLVQPDLVPVLLRTRDGAAAGMLTLQRIVPAQGVAEIALVMLGAGARRAAPGTEAVALLLRHLVEQLRYRRVEWKTDAFNAPSRAAADRLGFTFEGVFRNAVVYKGRTRDTAWYAMTDADWRAVRPAYDAWLAGLDATGTQRAPLAAREALAQARARAGGR